MDLSVEAIKTVHKEVLRLKNENKALRAKYSEALEQLHGTHELQLLIHYRNVAWEMYSGMLIAQIRAQTAAYNAELARRIRRAGIEEEAQSNSLAGKVRRLENENRNLQKLHQAEVHSMQMELAAAKEEAENMKCVVERNQALIASLRKTNAELNEHLLDMLNNRSPKIETRTKKGPSSGTEAANFRGGDASNQSSSCNAGSNGALAGRMNYSQVRELARELSLRKLEPLTSRLSKLHRTGSPPFTQRALLLPTANIRGQHALSATSSPRAYVGPSVVRECERAVTAELLGAVSPYAPTLPS